MNVIGVIAEYNPFHFGHLYQLEKIKEMYEDSIIIAVVSSCFTQRGDVSIINKWKKTEVCLDNGIDLVVELPFFYATQSSDIFAKGAISILNSLGVDTLVFGSECDDVELLKNVARMQLYDEDYNNIVKDYLSLGFNYPTSLSKAIKDKLGLEINKPNDLLALSYVKQVMLINDSINIVSIKRTNDYHGKVIDGNIVNASLIREYFRDGKDIVNYIPSYEIEMLYKDVSMENFYLYLRLWIINNIDNLDSFLDVDEGIENRIKKYIYEADSWEELVSLIKTKRYTYNRINRMLLHILVNLKKKDVEEINIDYIRVLGFNGKGKNHLNKIKKKLDVKVITNYKNGISNLLNLEYKISCIYGLIIDRCLIYEEISHKPIIRD